MTTQLKEFEALFKALGDATRLRIIGLLLNGEVCVCHIHESLRISQPKVSRHLAYLRAAGLVETRREGVWIHYRLADISDPLRKTIATAVQHTLGHVDVISKDARLLQRNTGCCLIQPVGLTSCICCSAADTTGHPSGLEDSSNRRRP
jgi:ArsR family transcriptional regulator, arsenate/arsenite/antimonite-responsive transcriptional repressor